MGIVDLTGIALSALLSENFILVSCMGIGTRTTAFESPKDALCTGGCLSVIMVLASLLAWACQVLFIVRFSLQHYQLLVLTLLVMGLIAGLRRALCVYLPALSQRVDAHLASITTNGAALGAALLVCLRSYSFGEALVFSLFGGLGATLVMASFASLRREVSFAHCPKVFQGAPMLFLTAGLMAMALIGFYGLHLG